MCIEIECFFFHRRTYNVHVFEFFSFIIIIIILNSFYWNTKSITQFEETVSARVAIKIKGKNRSRIKLNEFGWSFYFILFLVNVYVFRFFCMPYVLKPLLESEFRRFNLLFWNVRCAIESDSAKTIENR